MAASDADHVVVTAWPELTAADHTPVRAAGERAAYRAMLNDSSGPSLFLRAVRDGEQEIGEQCTVILTPHAQLRRQYPQH